jgi:hypothetical protein
MRQRALGTFRDHPLVLRFREPLSAVVPDPSAPSEAVAAIMRPTGIDGVLAGVDGGRGATGNGRAAADRSAGASGGRAVVSAGAEGRLGSVALLQRV